MKTHHPPKPPWGKILVFLLILWFLSTILSSFFSATSSKDVPTGNIAVIKIYGPIMATYSNGVFSGDGVSANNIIELLDRAEKDPFIDAVVLDINSGGGSAVGSDEIGRRVSEMNKPTVAWIREIGASGAYWIASSTDHIVANRMSLVGSIGVIGSYLEFSKLLDDYNVTYMRLVAGRYKDAGSPLKELTRDEEELLQDLIDELYDVFVKEVADNRGLEENYVRGLATGEVFSGNTALKLGLIDEVGSLPEVTKHLEETLNISIEYGELEIAESLSDLLKRLSSEQSFFIGRGIGSFLNTDSPVIRT